MDDLHHNNVNYSLASDRSLDYEARNCKMGYSAGTNANAVIVLVDPLHTISHYGSPLIGLN